MIKTMAIVNKLRTTGDITAKEALHLLGKLAIVLNSKREKPLDKDLLAWLASAITGNVDRPLGVSVEYLKEIARVSGFKVNDDDIMGLFDLLKQQNSQISKFVELF